MSKESHGSSPVGWTFWSTWLQCPRKWYLRYVKQLSPRQARDELTLGICYHALHEGKSEAEIAAMSQDHARLLPEAKRLWAARQKGPPMAEALAREEQATVLSGKIASAYTCRFDRRERDAVRELKTAGRVWESTDDYWQVNGEIIGQLLAQRDAQGVLSPKVIVDVITKERLPSTSQVVVTLDHVKDRRFNATIARQREEIVKALAATADGKSTDDQLIDHHFYANNENCIRFGKRCEFYDLCWGDSRRAAINFLVDDRNARWRVYLHTQQKQRGTHGEHDKGSRQKERRAAPSTRTRRK